MIPAFEGLDTLISILLGLAICGIVLSVWIGGFWLTKLVRWLMKRRGGGK